MTALRRARYALVEIATTGERFASFGPYVPAMGGGGVVAFQAALRGGGAGVFAGRGDSALTALAETSSELVDVVSHPDVTPRGDAFFYGEAASGVRGLYRARGGAVELIAEGAIGPLGPTVSDDGAVAFRATDHDGHAGVFVADDRGVTPVAKACGPFRAFLGLPLALTGGAVVFRAELDDGTQGIYLEDRGAIRALVDTTSTFESLAAFPCARDDGTVAFAGARAHGLAGVFTVRDGRVTAHADTTSGFAAFRGALLAGPGAPLLLATPRGGALGVFAGTDPARDRILAVGDTWRGATVTELAANPVSVHESGAVALRATLAGGREVILRADPVG